MSSQRAITSQCGSFLNSCPIVATVHVQQGFMQDQIFASHNFG